jgi:chromosomal replication initiation ATPase DnaA
MKQEGYSYSAIGRLLGRSHSTVIRMCSMMDDVFRFRFQPEMKLWNQYQTKLKRYEDERKDREL